MNDNVVQFPKLKLGAPPQTLEEISEKIAEYKTSFANELSEILWNMVLAEMVRAGCDFEGNEEELFPSMLLLLESIRSLHLHANGVHHALQDFAQEAFEDMEGTISVDKTEE